MFSYPVLLLMFWAMDARGIRWADLRNRRTLLRVGLVTALVLSATYGAAWLQPPANNVPAEIMLTSMNKAMVLRFIDRFLLFLNSCLDSPSAR